jgi:hypothetical protein
MTMPDTRENQNVFPQLSGECGLVFRSLESSDRYAWLALRYWMRPAARSPASMPCFGNWSIPWTLATSSRRTAAFGGLLNSWHEVGIID